MNHKKFYLFLCAVACSFFCHAAAPKSTIEEREQQLQALFEQRQKTVVAAILKGKQPILDAMLKQDPRLLTAQIHGTLIQSAAQQIGYAGAICTPSNVNSLSPIELALVARSTDGIAIHLYKAGARTDGDHLNTILHAEGRSKTAELLYKYGGEKTLNDPFVALLMNNGEQLTKIITADTNILHAKSDDGLSLVEAAAHLNALACVDALLAYKPSPIELQAALNLAAHNPAIYKTLHKILNPKPAHGAPVMQTPTNRRRKNPRNNSSKPQQTPAHSKIAYSKSGKENIDPVASAKNETPVIRPIREETAEPDDSEQEKKAAHEQRMAEIIAQQVHSKQFAENQARLEQQAAFNEAEQGPQSDEEDAQGPDEIAVLSPQELKAIRKKKLKQRTLTVAEQKEKEQAKLERQRKFLDQAASIRQAEQNQKAAEQESKDRQKFLTQIARNAQTRDMVQETRRTLLKQVVEEAATAVQRKNFTESVNEVLYKKHPTTLLSCMLGQEEHVHLAAFAQQTTFDYSDRNFFTSAVGIATKEQRITFQQAEKLRESFKHITRLMRLGADVNETNPYVPTTIHETLGQRDNTRPLTNLLAGAYFYHQRRPQFLTFR